MKIELIKSTPTPEVSSLMQSFETDFRYPLSETATFRISHGEDYTLFFRSRGESAIFIARSQNRILGSVAVCVRKLKHPDGSERSIAYLGDLKIAADGKRALLRLLSALQVWCSERVDAAFAVVMNGTSITPDRYSGRLGLCEFTRSGELTIVQIASSSEKLQGLPPVSIVDNQCVEELLERLDTSKCYSLERTTDATCSLMSPIWIASDSGRSIACLEDTRRGKRLFKDSGEELFNCHLTNFHFESPDEGRALIDKARVLAFKNGFGGVFVSLDSTRSDRLGQLSDQFSCLYMGATIYSSPLLGEAPLKSWYIHSSEV